ncbi:MAG TPA: bifunctional phosphoribosyl-AMP cyclohydrolase/phosphoribosyl-ATP diphosphatase HisIE [Kofleriaceae bacterium]|nr:bifunctional phosphoribosyl-AMP cyclohydrolase/phosphoribosyl-ATP diphosphatase HisIE [Kofleriaceae bacterium]
MIDGPPAATAPEPAPAPAPAPAYDERGLVPAIVQDAATGTVLMLAWMNAEALRLTRETGTVHFWSRSRGALWKKGETSGNTLAVVELRLDCDRDAILVRARPAGPACHTGKTSCFFTRVTEGGDQAGDPTGDPAGEQTDDGVPEAPAGDPAILARLAAILVARRDAATSERSYTRSLLDAGMPKILAKIAEEHGELAAELPAGDAAKVVHETADLIFHVMVGLVARDVPIDAVFAELSRRFGTSGHAEKAARR